MEMSGKRAKRTRGRGKNLKPLRFIEKDGRTFTMDNTGQYYYDN